MLEEFEGNLLEDQSDSNQVQDDEVPCIVVHSNEGDQDDLAFSAIIQDDFEFLSSHLTLPKSPPQQQHM